MHLLCDFVKKTVSTGELFAENSVIEAQQRFTKRNNQNRLDARGGKLDKTTELRFNSQFWFCFTGFDPILY